MFLLLSNANLGMFYGLLYILSTFLFEVIIELKQVILQLIFQQK